MAYSELIKNFGRIRAYLRSFYVHGFRHRDEYTAKSARSYDNERRRIESWLGDYMSFGQDESGRRVFLSVDSRAIPENPLYRAFRTRSFTDRDIMLHFHLLDILDGPESREGLSITGLMDELSERLSDFEDDSMPDESTVRKKLREYASLGLVELRKKGRETIYRRSEDRTDLASWDAAAAFFQEAAPLGVIGSFLRDRMPERFQKFRFKHHYILNALDSEILYDLFAAIRESRMVTLTVHKRQQITVLPFRIYIGTQTGRQYLLACSMAGRHGGTRRPGQSTGPAPGASAASPTGQSAGPAPGAPAASPTGQSAGPAPGASAASPTGQSAGPAPGAPAASSSGPAADPPPHIRFTFYRADLIDNVKTGEKTDPPEDLSKELDAFTSHVWGVAGSNAAPLQHIEMTVLAGPGEDFIVQRLEREKRCGTVKKLDDSHWRFSADVYDALEMLPWLRTFTGRIADLQCTDRRVIDRFRADFDALAGMYGMNSTGAIGNSTDATGPHTSEPDPGGADTVTTDGDMTDALS